MGMLVNGEWMADDAPAGAKGGAFMRKPSVYRNWITPDGAPGPSGEGGFPAESGRYHLYVSYACPWAHRTLIFRALKGLTDHISVDVVDADMLDEGWTLNGDAFGGTGDSLAGRTRLWQVYADADPGASSRVTVPVLWDKARGVIVSNESSEIIRMFNTAFDGITGDDQDFWPEAMQGEIEAVNARIYETLNNGVYRSGFAGSQAAYDAAVSALFDTMDWLEDRLSSRRYLMGDRVTEADWRLFPTLLRFDAVYVTHFKCDRARLTDYPNLWAYARELRQWPEVEETINMAHTRRHYFYSHETVNPRRIISIGPNPDWAAPHGRDGLSY